MRDKKNILRKNTILIFQGHPQGINSLVVKYYYCEYKV